MPQRFGFMLISPQRHEFEGNGRREREDAKERKRERRQTFYEETRTISLLPSFSVVFLRDFALSRLRVLFGGCTASPLLRDLRATRLGTGNETQGANYTTSPLCLVSDLRRVCGTILRRAWERGRPRPPRIARYRPRTRASGCRLTGGGVELRQPWAGGDARAPRGAKQCRTPRWNFSGFGRAGVIGRATRRLLDWWGTEPRSGMQVSRCSRMGAHEPEHPNA